MKWRNWRKRERPESESPKLPTIACGDERDEITFEVWIGGYKNNSHGQTCCLCGSLLSAIEVSDGFFSPRFPGIGQVELHFKRYCPHQYPKGWLWGGYVCSEACALGVGEWLVAASRWDICPEQHNAKGLERASPPKPILPLGAMDGIALNFVNTHRD